MIVEVEVLTAQTVAVTLRDSHNQWSTTVSLNRAQTVELADTLRGAAETQVRLWPETA